MNRKRLTLKQERFVKEYVKDGNATRAVRESYPNIRTEGAIRVMGAKLVTNANIQREIEGLLDKEGLTAELVIGELKKLVQDNDKSVKGKAIRTACEVLGLIGKNHINATLNIEQKSPHFHFNKEDLDRFSKIVAELKELNRGIESNQIAHGKIIDG